MLPRKRVQFTPQDVDAQLQSIHLLDSSSVTENLEALAPIVKTVYESRQQEAFLRTLKELTDSKDKEIMKICGENHQDFVSSVSTLLTVRSYTVNLRERIKSLDQSVTSIGRNLAAQKRELLQAKRTASNLDEAIDTLQGCLRILDLVKRVRDMIKEGRYFSALRSLGEIETLPPTALSNTPLYTHLLSSLPSLRAQVKDAVTAANIQWLTDVRDKSEDIGKLALEAMRVRARRWRSRKEKEPMFKSTRVGSAVELVTHDKIENNLFNNDQVTINFEPLYQAILIYTALSILPELQTSYQTDRMAQSSLIMSTLTTPHLLPTTLPSVANELIGFFLVEIEVLRTTIGFRSMREVEDLWDDVVKRLVDLVGGSVRSQRDMGFIADVKDTLTTFVQTIETYDFDIAPLQELLLSMFETHSALLEKQFADMFEKAVSEDDYQPIFVTAATERGTIFSICWMAADTAKALAQQGVPVTLPFSQVFYKCCTHIRQFVEEYYRFTEGATYYYRSTDDSLRESLDRLLATHVSEKISARLSSASTLPQAAQNIVNVEHFVVACAELEEQLTQLRTSRRGGHIYLQLSSSSFASTLIKAGNRLSDLIKSKLGDVFDLSDYDWTPPDVDPRPRMQMEELYHWLMTVIDSLPLENKYKDQAFKAALDYVASGFADFVFGPNVPMVNDNALANLMVDIDFLDTEFKNLGRSFTSFQELRMACNIAMNNQVSTYLQPATRRSQYSVINPKNLKSLLEKLSRYGLEGRNAAERESGARRRKEADAVARLI
ncbi:exocyst complex component, sec15 subunit [Cantharellus anzutake]|uniref:exocyst complex component, sec15 subunit n=1 Tax=Cantharellus anzutake TaxID=1750568 RepID=UPI0019042088|nr:exocyst complex component, sec15 subunit [Cantharellus anzutake]KAF8341518.1 exocyst complex component, sec15 subunit [Cantharellus anzutake]